MSMTMSKPVGTAPKAKKGDGWLNQMGIGVTRIRQGAAALIPGHSTPSSTVPPPPVRPTAPTPAKPIAAKQPDPAAVQPPAPTPPPAATAGPAADQRPDQNTAQAAAPPPAAPPGRAAYLEAMEKIKDATDHVKSANIGPEVVKLKAKFDAIIVPDVGTAPIQDHVKALAALKPKLDAADKIWAADAYDMVATKALPVVQKAGVFKFQSGQIKGLEANYDESAALQKKAEDALSRQQYQSAIDLIAEAKTMAAPICAYHETLAKAEQHKALFARAETLLGQKDLSPKMVQLKTGYENLSKSYEADLAAGDYVSMETVHGLKFSSAQTVLQVGNAVMADAWLESQMKVKAPKKRPKTPGIADKLATLPGLADMSEAERFDAMARRDRRPLNKQKEFIANVYGRALREGEKLKLSPSEVAAVTGYSGQAYEQVNGLLRGSLDTTKLNDATLDLIKLHAALLEKALQKLPVYPEAAFPLYRWETPYSDYLQTRYQPGLPNFKIKEFWSTGAGGGAAIAGTPTAEIIIWGKQGSQARQMSSMSEHAKEGNREDGNRLKGQGAGEVLYLPGTEFKPLSIEMLDDKGKLARTSASGIRYRIEVQEV